ncbi:MAG: proteasome lid subunit RPN8/RPN11 [Acidimicrobiales bacterium]|jgi:proteasome lid subunit RPN8/RPN11
MLSLDQRTWLAILAEAWRVEPMEACGLLLAANAEASIDRFVPIPNEAESSRVFTLEGRAFMMAERLADDEGLEVVGVVHSHTHTAAYPSATDVSQATKPLVPPTWHWAIVSLAWGLPELRSFRVVGGEESSLGMAEETILLKG